MALNREVWIDSIIEGLYADNTFAGRSINHSQFVSHKTVHVPNAGAGPNVVKNRSTLPAAVTTRGDIDLTYNIDEFTTDPIHVIHAETVELSYNKRESVVRVSRNALINKVHQSLLDSWLTGAGILTPGANVRATLLAAKKQFDTEDVPQAGRCVLLSADSYNNLVDQLTDIANANFLAGASVESGALGRLFGFDIYERSTLDGSNEGLVWHEDSVSRALGSVEFFENEKDPTWYGDIISFLVRAGGSPVRNDGIGLLKF